MANEDLKNYARGKNVKLWQVAHVFNISDGNFSRKLRFEWDDTEKEKFRAAVDEIMKNDAIEKIRQELVQGRSD